MKLRRFYNLLVTICLCLVLTANAEAEPERHSVPVGMYNTYSAGDGNLGSARPDLQEVWEGVPGVSNYEACNITMHYWPWPNSLPSVGSGENRYAAWWKQYMEEAYELTNQDGEIRLRVIVGPLYEYYRSHSGETFRDFVEDLCQWEKDSEYMGTLAGWYLAEEPMGSVHNYDADTVSEMADAIEAAERSAGADPHRMYIDISVDGKYFSNSSLADFTRTADVVMISASTYVWSSRSSQPVYTPNWNTVHGPLKQVRDIVYSDRRRRNLSYPEFHVVLEGWDTAGYGQPTNWEMRQQIHLALSQSLPHADPPADGVWFFWWTQMARDLGNDTDDWNHGRRLGEAIQIQVARSTFRENLSVRNDIDPPETRFRFPEHGSFNPTTSCIPYDLAEPGNVIIEIFDENMALVRDFDMKYQVAGELRRFGGPYWHKGSSKDGHYIFRLYLDSKLMDEVKIRVQWNIKVNSTSHQPGVWSRNSVVAVQWEPPSKEIEGMDGYSFLWDTSRNTYPDDIKDIEQDVTNLKSDPLPDGDNNYFHIRSRDGEGRWSTAIHLGPFFIDTTPPGNVRDLASDSHTPGEWSQVNRISVYWNPAEDTGSGIAGYSVLWDEMPGTLPDDDIDISGEATMLASEPLADGVYYLHIRSVDKAGNWAYRAAHIGPFTVDTQPPDNVTDLLSSSHVPGRWSNNDTVILNWSPAEDTVSGIDGYSILWDNLPDTIPDEVSDTEALSTAYHIGYGGDSVYFHIRAVDNAGNWVVGARHIGPFMVDKEPPSTVEGLVTPTHDPGEWSGQSAVEIVWTPAEDNVSGMGGYEWSILPNDWKNIDQPPLHIPNLDDGIWNIHVRAVDNAGNRGEADHVMVKIDTEPPTAPIISSSSHPDSRVWYADMDVSLEWMAEDDRSGVDGYNWLWNTNALSAPTKSAKNAPESVLEITAESPGVWYFHVRAVDNAGNWGAVSHYKIQVDTSAPPAPEIVSDTHRSGEWMAGNNVRLSWKSLSPSPSGVAGYSYLIDHSPLSVPSEVLINETGMTEYTDLPDGVWFFHCRTKSGAGLWGEAAHYEIRIDTKPPTVLIVYPESDVWYNKSISEYSGLVEDNASGVDPGSFQYSYRGGAWMSFRIDEVVSVDGVWRDLDEIPTSAETHAGPLSIRVRDKAGNVAESDTINILIDTSIASPTVRSPTHPDQNDRYKDRNPQFLWHLDENLSGVDGYSWTMDQSETTIPPQVIITRDSSATARNLTDGIWYFHIRAKDNAGNWSEAAHYRLMLDSTTPTAKIEISGEVVTDGNTPLVRPGQVSVMLTISERVSEPMLEYIPDSAVSPIPVYLTSIDGSVPSDKWTGTFDVSAETGDGITAFSFSAKDDADNEGNEIAGGKFFIVDSIPPTAKLKISGLAVTDADLPVAHSGPVKVLLKASENIDKPSLKRKLKNSVESIPIELAEVDAGEWRGKFDVTIRTGDGEMDFLFSAKDAAGNMGETITDGGSFIIDTLTQADARKPIKILCVTEPETSIILPPGAISQNMRIEIARCTAHLMAGVMAMYEVNAYDFRMKELEGLIFNRPVEMVFSPKVAATDVDVSGVGVHFWDGVRWQRIQDDWTSLRIDCIGRFALMNSKPLDSGMAYGWATPNPFTPNGSGNATDRTVFHVASEYGSTEENFEVKIYDINGLMIKHLRDGRRSWDGRDSNGRFVEGGLYIYQIDSGDQIISGTVVVLR